MDEKTKCSMCGKEKSECVTWYGGIGKNNFCCHKCCEEQNKILREKSLRKQKHEKVEKMAWGYCRQLMMAIYYDKDAAVYSNKSYFEEAWKYAEQFYDYAKEKEKEL